MAQAIESIIKYSIGAGENKIVINTNRKFGLPMENINKIAGPFAYGKIRTAYIGNPDYIFIILSLNIEIYSKRNDDTGLMDGTMKVVDYNAYDLKYLSPWDILPWALAKFNLGASITLRLNYEQIWEFCQLLDKKYLHSTRRNFEVNRSI